MSAAVSLSVRREPIIELVNVSKDYDTGGGVVHAMRDVSLRIAHGEFVAIVGTSGSGKSTMMNILGCLDRPTRGTYTLCGIDVGARGGDARAIVRNRVIGFIFQGFNLLPRTTALENCELPLQYRGVGGRQRRKRAEEALRAVGLGERMDHKPNQLSGGQQQRVAIARALVTSPPLLLADEPTGNLDTRTSLEVLALLQRLNRDRGISIVLVTHERDIAACASRVITMRDGRIVSDVVHDAPMDAAAELANLPLPDVGKAAFDDDGGADPTRAAKAHLGGPVPFSVYPMMILGELLGAAAGFAYVSLVLGAHGEKWMLVPPVVGELGKAWAGAEWARRRLGGPATVDQRARVALWYTLAALTFQGTVVFCVAMFLPKAQPYLSRMLDLIPASGTMAGPGVIGAVAALVAFLTLLRYLLLSLFSTPWLGPRPGEAADVLSRR
jgi:putative ABC transport system ATP-binding protein